MANTRSNTISVMLGWEAKFDAGLSRFEPGRSGTIGPFSQASKEDIANDSSANQPATDPLNGEDDDQLAQSFASWPSPSGPAHNRSQLSNYLQSFGITNQAQLQAPPPAPQKLSKNLWKGVQLHDPSAPTCSDPDCHCNLSASHQQQQQLAALRQSGRRIDAVNAVVPRKGKDAIARAPPTIDPDQPSMPLDHKYCPLNCMDRAMAPSARAWEGEENRQNAKRRRMTADEINSATQGSSLRRDDAAYDSDKTLSGDDHEPTGGEKDAMILRARSAAAVCRSGVTNTPRHDYQATAVRFRGRVAGAPAPLRRVTDDAAWPSTAAPTTPAPVDVDDEDTIHVERRPPLCKASRKRKSADR